MICRTPVVLARFSHCVWGNEWPYKKGLALKAIRITKTCQSLPKGLSMEKEKVCVYQLCIGSMEAQTE